MPTNIWTMKGTCKQLKKQTAPQFLKSYMQQANIPITTLNIPLTFAVLVENIKGCDKKLVSILLFVASQMTSICPHQVE